MDNEASERRVQLGRIIQALGSVGVSLGAMLQANSPHEAEQHWLEIANYMEAALCLVTGMVALLISQGNKAFSGFDSDDTTRMALFFRLMSAIGEVLASVAHLRAVEAVSEKVRKWKAVETAMRSAVLATHFGREHFADLCREFGTEASP